MRLFNWPKTGAVLMPPEMKRFGQLEDQQAEADLR